MGACVFERFEFIDTGIDSSFVIRLCAMFENDERYTLTECFLNCNPIGDLVSYPSDVFSVSFFFVSSSFQSVALRFFFSMSFSSVLFFFFFLKGCFCNRKMDLKITISS